MDSIIEAFNGFTGLKGKKDDDFVDRLNSRYTVIVILVFAAIVTFYQFGGSPIHCWCPPHFTEAHMLYVYSYCWIKNTYYLPMNEPIPKADEEGKREMLIYYQWIPFVLLLQALFFYFPSLIWHGLNSKSGVDCDNILAVANKLNKTDQADARDGILMLISNQIGRFLGSRKIDAVPQSKIKQCFSSLTQCCGRRMGSYLTVLFLVTKFFYLGNILFQLHILNGILGTKYNTYGIEVMKGMWSDHDWTESYDVAFPRVSMCDFDVRRLGNNHRYTVQCALPLNMFNEKIYVFLWFWLIIVCGCTIFGLIIWLTRAIFRGDKFRFITNHLHNGGRLETDEDTKLVNEFLDKFLRQDGIFVLRLISHNTNNITTCDIICAVWDVWQERRMRRPASNGVIPVLSETDDDIDIKRPLSNGEA